MRHELARAKPEHRELGLFRGFLEPYWIYGDKNRRKITKQLAKPEGFAVIKSSFAGLRLQTRKA